MKLVLLISSLFFALTNAYAGREGHGLLPQKYICFSDEQTTPEIRVEFVLYDNMIISAYLFKNDQRLELFECVDNYSSSNMDEQLKTSVGCRPLNRSAIDITLKESLVASLLIVTDHRQLTDEDLTGSYSCL